MTIKSETVRIMDMPLTSGKLARLLLPIEMTAKDRELFHHYIDLIDEAEDYVEVVANAAPDSEDGRA